MNTELPHYRTLIESALVYAGWDHTFEDVVKEVVEGRAQFWPGPHSCIVTKLIDLPRQSECLVWLAAGDTNEMKAMIPALEEWARGEGCVKATLIGRKGWGNSFLRDIGWAVTDDIIMEKRLNG